MDDSEQNNQSDSKQFNPHDSQRHLVIPPVKNNLSTSKKIGITIGVTIGVIFGIASVGAILLIAGYATLISLMWPTVDSYEPNMSEPTATVIMPPSDTSVHVYKADTNLSFVLNSPNWIGPSWDDGAGSETGYSDVTDSCVVAFYPVADGSVEFGDIEALSEPELKQDFFINFMDESIITTQAELEAQQKTYSVPVGDKPMEIIATPVSRENGGATWIGIASWPYEQTYVEVMMNCQTTTTPEEAKTIWEAALNEVVITEK